MTNNPFQIIDDRLGKIENILLNIQNTPKEDLSNKRYDLKEASQITGLTPQTLRAKIKKGIIKAEQIGRKFSITHNNLYDSFNEVKSLRYKR